MKRLMLALWWVITLSMPGVALGQDDGRSGSGRTSLRRCDQLRSYVQSAAARNGSPLQPEERRALAAHRNGQTGDTRRRCAEDLVRVELLSRAFDEAGTALDAVPAESEHALCLRTIQLIGVEAQLGVNASLPNRCPHAMEALPRLTSACVDPQDLRIARFVVPIAAQGCVDEVLRPGLGTTHPLVEAASALQVEELTQPLELYRQSSSGRSFPWGMTDALLVTRLRILVESGDWLNEELRQPGLIERGQDYLTRLQACRGVAASQLVLSPIELGVVTALMADQAGERLRRPETWCRQSLEPALRERSRLFAAGADLPPVGAEPALRAFIPERRTSVAISRAQGEAYLRGWCRPFPH